MSRPDGGRFVWSPDQVHVTRPCQACGKPADDPEIPGLCQRCAATIDSSYEAKRDEAGP